VDDPSALVDAVADLDQGIDPVIVEFGPIADHVNDVDVGGVEMKTGAALGLGALVRDARQLHAKLAVGGRSNPGIPIDKEGAQAAVGIAGFGRMRFLMAECRLAHFSPPHGVRRPHPAPSLG